MDNTTRSNDTLSNYDSETKIGEPVFCTQCSRAFKHRKFLKDHLRNVCGIAKRYQCDYCRNKYMTKSSLKRHISTTCSNARIQV